MTWYLDPDYIGSDFTFLAVSGYYSVDIFLDHKFCLFKRVSASGVPLTSSDGAIWLMAWGLAAHTMDGVQTEGGQLAFTPGTSYCMAEYAPGKYRFSGIAVEEKDGTTIGGRFRYDYLSIKYFGQDGWGNEKGKIFGATTTVQYTERCKDIIGGDGSDNISLLTHKETVGGEEKDIPDHPLDLGATYVLELDLTTPGIELIDFYKK